ncbi:hypothetical protein [Curtobacterium sp. ISL-83]|uniref:hypothetical protein n=1 Tax=Curtobacterium sp. ISL-83 TaxID=2819145 RepID=UPI001BEA31C7|nr:hypothetical protein [Curtobacterium sp. ISL-83]MBT2502632.1 hypothetical protein [Curtobacterium sp. ISL-83]
MVTWSVIGLVVVSTVLVALLVTPPERRRGLCAALATVALVFGVSPTAPDAVQLTTQFGAIGLFGLGAVLPGGQRAGRPDMVLVFLVAFGVVGVAVGQVAYPAGTTLLLRLIATAVAGYVCCRRLGPDDRDVFLTGLVVVALAECAIGVIEFFVTTEPVPWGAKRRDDGSARTLVNPLLGGGAIRVSGTVGHPIPYAAVLAVALISIVSRKRRLRPWVLWVCVPALALGLLLSGSRSVFLGVAAGLLLLLWNAQSGVVVRVAAVGVATTIAVVVFSDQILTAFAYFFESGSYLNRAGSISAVPLLLERVPLEVLFGSGFGSDAELYRRGFFPQADFRVIDNQLVTTLGTTGVTGLALVLGMLIVALRRGDVHRRSMLVLWCAMSFSFDYLSWFAMLALFAMALAWPAETTGNTGRPSRTSVLSAAGSRRRQQLRAR